MKEKQQVRINYFIYFLNWTRDRNFWTEPDIFSLETAARPFADDFTRALIEPEKNVVSVLLTILKVFN